MEKITRIATHNVAQMVGFISLLLSLKELTRLRTYPQHTLSLLPLLRSRPGGVHKTSVVRSPKSDEQLKHCRLPNANCQCFNCSRLRAPHNARLVNPARPGTEQ